MRTIPVTDIDDYELQNDWLDDPHSLQNNAANVEASPANNNSSEIPDGLTNDRNASTDDAKELIDSGMFSSLVNGTPFETVSSALDVKGYSADKIRYLAAKHGNMLADNKGLTNYLNNISKANHAVTLFEIGVRSSTHFRENINSAHPKDFQNPYGVPVGIDYYAIVEAINSIYKGTKETITGTPIVGPLIHETIESIENLVDDLLTDENNEDSKFP